MLGMRSLTCVLLIDIVNLIFGAGAGLSRRGHCLALPHLPVAFRNGSLLLALKEREKT